MRLKTYFSNSIQAAVRIAKTELGDQAVLLGTKDAPADGESRYEITFGTTQDERRSRAASDRPQATPVPRPHWKRFVPRELEPEADAADAESAAEATNDEPAALTATRLLNRDPEWRRLRAGIDELYRVIEAVPPAEYEGESFGLVERLRASGMDEEQAVRFAGNSGTASAADFSTLSSALRRELHWEAPFDLPERRAVLAFTGPAGVGKSAALTKLARRFTGEGSRRLALISINRDDLGLMSPQRFEAASLGAEFRSVDSADRLAETVRTIQAEDERALILIDTAALAAGSPIGPAQLGSCLAAFQARVYLTINTTTESAACHKIVESYRCLAPSRLILTHVEDAARFGGLVSELARAGLTVSFLSSDAAGANDFTAATPDAMARMLLGKGIV